MSRRDRTLARDTSDQKIAGVCSGIARYFDIDPLLVRVGFVAALFVGGGTAIAYLLLWWLLPVAADETSDQAATAPTTNPPAPPAPPAPVAPDAPASTTTGRAA